MAINKMNFGHSFWLNNRYYCKKTVALITILVPHTEAASMSSSLVDLGKRSSVRNYDEDIFVNPFYGIFRRRSEIGVVQHKN